MSKKNIFLIFLICLCFSTLADSDIDNSIKLNIKNNYNILQKNMDNPHDYSNWLTFPYWNDFTLLTLSLDTNIKNNLIVKYESTLKFFKMNSDTLEYIQVFQPRYYNDYYSFSLDKLSIFTMLFDGAIIIELGKFLPCFGVGYNWKPTNFISNHTGGMSKYLIDINYFHPLFVIQGIYAPAWSFLPDDYGVYTNIDDSNDMWLLKGGFTFDQSDLGILLFFEKNFAFGVNFNTQLGDEFIPYFEGVFSFNTNISHMSSIDGFQYGFAPNDFWFYQFLIGINYSPLTFDFAFYLELYYNGDGYSIDDWEQYMININNIKSQPNENLSLIISNLNEAYVNFKFGNMSQYYAMLHIRQIGYLFDIMNFKGTLVATFPLGLISSINIEFKFPYNLQLNFDMTSLLYAGSESEYLFSPMSHNFTASLQYVVQL